MSYVDADVMYKQLQQLLAEGADLADYKVVDCDAFAGEAIIYEKDADEE